MSEGSADHTQAPAPDRAIRFKVGCAGIAAAILLITVLSCSLLAFGLHGGTLAPPRIDSSIGPLRLVGYSTWNGSCPPYTGCAPTQRNAFVIWLIWQSGTPTQGSFQLLDEEIAP